MQHVGYIEAERRYLGVKTDAIIRDHLVAAMHGADRGFHHGARGIAEVFTRLQVGILADNTIAFDFLCLAVPVGNNPVTGQ